MESKIVLRDDELVFSNGIQLNHIIISKILYIESNGHYVYFYVNNSRNGFEIELVKLRAKLDEIEQILDRNFLRIHQRYIVNLKYSVSMNSRIIRIRVSPNSSIRVPIARSKARLVSQKTMN